MKKVLFLVVMILISFGINAQEIAQTVESSWWSGLWDTLVDIGIWSVISAGGITLINWILGMIPSGSKWSFLLGTIAKLAIAWLEKMPDKRKKKA